MTAACLLLLGCSTPDDRDSDPTTDDTAVDDTADSAGDDTGDGLQPVDLCDNGVDDDGDGETDEAGCAVAWFAGEESEYVGTCVGVVADAPQWWAVRAEGRSEVRPALFDLDREGTRMVRGWQVTSASDLAHIEAFGLELHGGEAYVAYGYSNETRIESIPEAGGVAVPVVTLPWGGNASWGPSALSSGASGLEALVPQYDGLIARYPDVLSGSAPEPDAVFTADDGCCFGREAAFLEDANGTGTTAALVLSRDPDGEDNHLYLFAADTRGVAAPADADAVFPLEYGLGGFLRPVGDPDGDGYPDISMYTGAVIQVAFGPYSGSVPTEDTMGMWGEALTGQGSLDGDTVDDLVLTRDDQFYFVHGPLNRESVLLSAQDSERLMPVELGTRSWVWADVVDLDGDGVPWLLASYQSYGGQHGIPERAGLVTAHPLPEWVEFE